MEPAPIYEAFENKLSPDSESIVIWKGSDPILFQAILDQLNSAGILFHAGPDRDLAGPVPIPLTRASALDTELLQIRIASKDSERGSEILASVLRNRETGFCPLCKGEIFIGFEKCEDCNCGLVATPASPVSNPIVFIWRMMPKNLAESILHSIQGSGIRHNGEVWHSDDRQQLPRDYGIFLSIFRSDQQETLNSINARIREFGKGEKEFLEKELQIEIWAGTSYDEFKLLFETLKAREIPCESLRRWPAYMLSVIPSLESRARETVREILEALSPK